LTDCGPCSLLLASLRPLPAGNMWTASGMTAVMRGSVTQLCRGRHDVNDCGWANVRYLLRLCG
jgi:hypothetical protein